MTSQEQIIKECQKGDLDNFRLIYDDFFDKIYRFIYYKTHHKQTAEDLTSKTFIKALEKINSFNFRKGLFSSWIYRIARNNVIDYYRTNKKNLDISGIWDLGESKDFNKTIDDRDKLVQVARYLKKFTPEQREIIIMRIWDGLSYKEISEITGKKEGNCKMIFFRTMTKLRQEIPLVLLISLLIKTYE